MNKVYEVTVKVLGLIVLINLTILTSSLTIDRLTKEKPAEKSEQIIKLEKQNEEFNRVANDLLDSYK